MIPWYLLIPAIIFGAIIGMFIMACCYMSRRSDEEAEIEFLKSEIRSLAQMLDCCENQKAEVMRLYEKIREN